jgi:LPXTG-motif cell wall-anchored protein
MGLAGVNPFLGDNGTMDLVFIGLVIVLLISLSFLAWRRKTSTTAEPARKGPYVLPPNVTLRPQPLLTDADLLLYNLIRLAVEDHYFVFARVPLWSVVSVEAERTARSQVLRQIALKQLDFVLVHPGTKTADHVVLLDAGSPLEPHEVTRKQEIESVLHAAGITSITLSLTMSYTVPQLAQLLGVSDDD